MKPSSVPIVVLGLSLAVAPALAPNAAAQDRPEREAIARANDLSRAFQYVSKRIGPAVVNIAAIQRAPREDRFDLMEEWFGRRPRDEGRGGGQSLGQGSGVIVRPDGHILTNYHVVQDATEITVGLSNGRQYDARVVGTDEETDLAVIKIDATDLATAAFGDSDNVEVGQWVVAVGNPFGLDHSVTAGIISAIGRPSMGLAYFGNLLQTDAAINPGNSGGPLVNLNGEVVGINNAITTQTGGYMGIGFAIPGNMASSVLSSILEHGEVVRGWLGITMRPVQAQEADEIGFDGMGIIVVEVSNGGPAEAAGLRTGDIITELNGRGINNSSQLQNSVARRTPGSNIAMTVYRDGNTRQVDVTLGLRPPERELQLATGRGVIEFEQLGVIVAEVNERLAERLELEIDRGVIVLELDEDGRAAKNGIEEGDVLSRVDGTRIESMSDFAAALDDLTSDEATRIKVHRGSKSWTVLIE